jgi:GAF domain-containing protein
LPIDSTSLAGSRRAHRRSDRLAGRLRYSGSLPFHFNQKFDEQSGYRSKSMLIVPIKNPQGEIIGVVQLINCKRAQGAHVDNEPEDGFVPYPAHCRPLLDSLASQAAVAIENNRLDESIETLFEGFVRASVGRHRVARPGDLRPFVSRRRLDDRVGRGGGSG